MTFVEIVMMFGAFIALAIALGQWIIKNQRPTNRWLCFLMISCSVWILLAVCYRIDLFQQYPHLNKLHIPFLSITGPLWYKYIYSLHETNTPHSFRYHLIIPITVTVVLALPFYLESGAYKREYVETNLEGFASVMMYTATRYAEITVIVYCIKSIFYLRQVNQESSKQRSVNTVHFLLMLSVLAMLAGMTRFVGSVFNLQSASTAIPTIIISCLLLSLFLLGHRKPVVLGLDRSESHIKVVTDKDVLTLKDCRHKLKTKKWFLDPNLKLQKLARKLEIPPNRLSELINNADGVNFNEFVNELRIEHAQTLMTEDPGLSNDDIANLSGFNSRSVFYRKFKQKTGITPSEFKKKRRIPKLV